MDRLGTYLKKNLTLALKAVLYNFRQYAVFFIAIFLVQTLLGIITAASDNDNILEHGYVSDEYDYHVLLSDLNEQQRLTLVNDTQTVFGDEYIFDIVRETARSEEGAYDRRYDLYISLHEDLDTNYRIFEARYFHEMAALSEEGLRVSTSPLMHFDRNLRANRIYYLIFLSVLTVVSVFFLMSLYSVRLNHYNFTYGIYMTYGADFKKMFGTAFWEMFVIAAITFIPSCIVSAVTDLIIYVCSGERFTWRITGSLKVLLFSMVIISLSVILPMWRLSRREPMNALIAEDNSNLVISPRQSFDLSKTRFPSGYCVSSLWRFRKYQIRQILTSVIFIAMFMSVLFYADVCRKQLDYDLPQFTANFAGTGYTYTVEDYEYLSDISGITALSKDVSTRAADIHSHAALDSSDVKLSARAAYLSDGSGDRAVNSVSYHPCDSEILEFLGRYSCDGDPGKVLSEDVNYIIVTDGYDNISRFRFKPGDVIRIGKAVRQRGFIGDNLSGLELLDKELDSYYFEYTEFTVCAVLKDIPCFGGAPLYMRTDLYETITDSQAVYDTVDIYIDKDSDISEVNRIKEDIRKWTELYEGVSLADRNTASEYRIEKAKCKPVIYTVCAFIALVFAPLIQIFTQTLYYEKREGEFDILRAFGAVSGEIRSIHMGDGIFGMVSGVILSQAINLGAVYAVFYFCNVIIPKFGGVDIRYPFAMPIFAILLGIAVAAASAMISSHLPYRSYLKKKREDDTAENLTSEPEH